MVMAILCVAVNEEMVWPSGKPVTSLMAVAESRIWQSILSDFLTLLP
jgi:hypothetical protein